MANGVGTPRIIKGVKYYPIYENYKNRKIVNTMVKAESEAEARHILKDRIAEYHKKLTTPVNGETNYDIIREELRKSVNSDIAAHKTRNLYMNVFNRVFVDFRQKHFVTLSGCTNLPKGFFIKYKSYACEELKRNWRAELIYVKAIMKRLTDLGHANEDDLKQARSIPTPEGTPKLMPKHTDKQIDDLLEYIEKDRPDFYKPIKFMQLVGRRPAETCSIKRLEDVNADGFDPISIQTKPETAKMKKQIPPLIYLEDRELKTLIKSALANNKTPWLFPHRDGGKIHPNYLWKYLSKTSLEVIGVNITPRFFRKKFLTKSNLDGLNKASMDMANIKNVTVMMKHYQQGDPEGQRKLLEKNRQRTYNGS